MHRDQEPRGSSLVVEAYAAGMTVPLRERLLAASLVDSIVVDRAAASLLQHSRAVPDYLLLTTYYYRSRCRLAASTAVRYLGTCLIPPQPRSRCPVLALRPYYAKDIFSVFVLSGGLEVRPLSLTIFLLPFSLNTPSQSSFCDLFFSFTSSSLQDD